MSDLNSRGLFVDPYNPCVANMVANGKQINITWHIDAFKILHVGSDEVKN